MNKGRKRKAVRSAAGLTTLDGFLKDQGKLEDFQGTAVKEVVAWRFTEDLKNNPPEQLGGTNKGAP
jgi:hypothetical protein